ncbi:MAG: DUF302 domain-containing protein [gamma proteobacterium symbiont of Bathyaustriella thionipta]|nr:DUF302 domain-containing protein [gamma proteobacterium symbiont of Bathyaustriella thionipta]
MKVLNTRFHSQLIAVALMLWAGSAAANHPIMARTVLDFHDTMNLVQEQIIAQGYAVAHIQKCDGGLHHSGYKTDHYRSIFFGKLQETRELSQRFPEMAAFLPLKIVVFSENDETVIAALNPEDLKSLMKNAELTPYLDRWSSDIHKIMDIVRQQSRDI